MFQYQLRPAARNQPLAQYPASCHSAALICSNGQTNNLLHRPPIGKEVEPYLWDLVDIIFHLLWYEFHSLLPNDFGVLLQSSEPWLDSVQASRLIQSSLSLLQSWNSRHKTKNMRDAAGSCCPSALSCAKRREGASILSKRHCVAFNKSFKSFLGVGAALLQITHANKNSMLRPPRTIKMWKGTTCHYLALLYTTIINVQGCWWVVRAYLQDVF